MPFLAFSPSMPTWHVGAPGTFPMGTRAHYTNSVAWTHGLPWPITSVPGVPSTQYAYFTSHAPSRSIISCTLQKGFVPSFNIPKPQQFKTAANFRPQTDFPPSCQMKPSQVSRMSRRPSVFIVWCNQDHVYTKQAIATKIQKPNNN